MLKSPEIFPGLFRSEFPKMVAVICKLFGLRHIETAEDIVSETFLEANRLWKQNGIPMNPTAWLYVVAKQKTFVLLRRNKIWAENNSSLMICQETGSDNEEDLYSSLNNIRDSQLQMLFAICHPVIKCEAQVALALRILCGYSIDEIADAFCSNKEAIQKRLNRAKEKLKAEKISMELPSESGIDARLDNVLQIIYMLFNEKYYCCTQRAAIRKDFCQEALRLALLLSEFDPTNTPKTNAFIALICFHTSHFDAKQNKYSNLVFYDTQNESLWSKELIKKGKHFLVLSSEGNNISKYHIEAGLAFWHCNKEETNEKWNNILLHYDLLLQMHYTPAVALKRIYALSKVKDVRAAITETENTRLIENHFYFLLLGELYSSLDAQKAKGYFQRALLLSETEAEKNLIQQKILTLCIQNEN